MYEIIPKAGTIICYTGQNGVVNGVWQHGHIHGRKIKDVSVDVIYKPEDENIEPLKIKREYALFRLDDGTEFMAYDDNIKWSWFSGHWPEAPDCCKQVYRKYFKRTLLDIPTIDKIEVVNKEDE